MTKDVIFVLWLYESETLDIGRISNGFFFFVFWMIIFDNDYGCSCRQGLLMARCRVIFMAVQRPSHPSRLTLIPFLL